MMFLSLLLQLCRVGNGRGEQRPLGVAYLQAAEDTKANKISASSAETVSSDDENSR